MIILTVNDKEISVKQSEILTTNNVGLPAVSFEFDDSWDTLTKTAVFKNGKQADNYKVLLDENNECIVPFETLKSAGNLEISIFGIYNNEIVKTTHYVNVGTIYQGADTDAGEPQEHTPSLYEQVVTMMEQQAVNADLAREYSGTATTKAGEAFESADRAYQSEVNAKASEDKAKLSEDSAAESATIASNSILNGVANHNTSESSHPSLLAAVSLAESIARGRATAYVFDTYADMMAWLSDPAHTEGLIAGDNLYIRDTGVKDYWWDGAAAQPLEAEAPNLTDYYTKTEIDGKLPIQIEQTDYDALVSSGTVIAGRIYYVVPDGSLGGTP